MAGFFKQVVAALSDTKNLNEPIVAKRELDTTKIVSLLQEQLQNATEQNTRKKLSRRIKLFELGLHGENKVLFELKNLNQAAYIIQDYRFEIDEQHVQIDFLLVTRKYFLVIEVKNYYGDIYINSKDEFIRKVYKNGRLRHEEGFYSPIRQVERQKDLLKRYLKDELNIISKTPIHHVVVFANERTIIRDNEANSEIKNHVIRADQLKKHIENLNKQSSPVDAFDNSLKLRVEQIIANHKSSLVDTIEKSDEKFLEDTLEITINSQQEENLTHESKNLPIIDTDLLEELKTYRTAKAKELAVKPFYIYTNQTLEDIVHIKPNTLDKLMKIKGISEKKSALYGQDILDIINQYIKQ